MDSIKIYCIVIFYGFVFWKEWFGWFLFFGCEGCFCGIDVVKFCLGRNIWLVFVKVVIFFLFNFVIVFEEFVEIGFFVKFDVRYLDC